MKLLWGTGDLKEILKMISIVFFGVGGFVYAFKIFDVSGNYVLLNAGFLFVLLPVFGILTMFLIRYFTYDKRIIQETWEEVQKEEKYKGLLNLFNRKE